MNDFRNISASTLSRQIGTLFFEKIVEELRRDYRPGMAYKDLAAQYGLARGDVAAILENRICVDPNYKTFAERQAEEKEQRRVKAEAKRIEAAGRKQHPTNIIEARKQTHVTSPTDGWAYDYDSWHFHRRLLEHYKIVLEFGEYSAICDRLRHKKDEVVTHEIRNGQLRTTYDVYFPRCKERYLFIVANPWHQLITALVPTKFYKNNLGEWVRASTNEVVPRFIKKKPSTPGGAPRVELSKPSSGGFD